MILFDTWQDLFRISATALLFYPVIIISVRIAGKRSTAKMNNFDWIVTIAMGSIMGSVILLKDVTIFGGITSIATLLGLQYALTKLSVKMPVVSKVIHADLALLFYDGRFQERTMAAERVTRDEIEAAVRTKGYNDMSEIVAVIMEADAGLSVIKRAEGAADLLKNIKNQTRG